jgi:uncharacterized protein (DUF2132 family)
MNKPNLNGITLEMMVTQLSENVGWDVMAGAVPVRCFMNNPTVKSSLAFLRKTPWARSKVEQMYVEWLAYEARGK